MYSRVYTVFYNLFLQFFFTVVYLFYRVVQDAVADDDRMSEGG